MKKCPFCAEQIQDDAIKCKHCGEFMNGFSRESLADKNTPWYLRKSFIVIAVLSVGPLALPLIWLRPQTALAWKIGLTAALLVVSWILFQTTLEFIRALNESYKLIGGALK